MIQTSIPKDKMIMDIKHGHEVLGGTEPQGHNEIVDRESAHSIAQRNQKGCHMCSSPASTSVRAALNKRYRCVTD